MPGCLEQIRFIYLVNFHTLNKLERSIISKRMLFRKVTIMPKGTVTKGLGCMQHT